MSMGMGFGQYMSHSMRHDFRVSINWPSTSWSLLAAIRKVGINPPPYQEPDYDAEVFTPRLKFRKMRIDPDFDMLPHVAKMWMVDEANEVFRFAYNDGDEEELDDDDQLVLVKKYYRIPLLRDSNVDAEDIAEEIELDEYERATAILAAVGDLERIVRAIPYYGLYADVTEYLRAEHSAELKDIVLVAVDRGGRLPCIILMHALGLSSMETLKVDQASGDTGRLDEDRLCEFVERGVFQNKHVLFVDSTVDSGRQIRVLQRYFEDSEWKKRLGHRSWSVVGSNEDGEHLEHHHNVNWGVDPDDTFEDDPNLMGIDYAPGSFIRVVDRPSETSEAIRKCLLRVPDGYVYWADDIDEQIEEQRGRWKARQLAKCGSVEEAVSRLTQMDRWQYLKGRSYAVEETVPDIQRGEGKLRHLNVLIVGRGQMDMPEPLAQFVADTLGPHCSFFAGTPNGNPGAVLNATLKSSKVQTPEVRLYQPKRMERSGDATFGGVPVIYVGDEKEGMRRQMISDSHAVLVLGGAEGTLREVLLSLRMGKPTILIQGYGPVADWVLGSKRLQKLGNLKSCAGFAQAMQTILDMSKT